MTLVLALLAGALIGLSLGALGGGGSILAVPVLVYLLGQSPAQATTGSLVVVGVTSLVAAVTAHRAGRALVARGVVFGLVATGGAVAGAKAAAHVDEDVLLAAFAALMLLVGGLMATRQLRHRRGTGPAEPDAPAPQLDDPIITFRPTFACACPRALKVLVTATVVGALTGFLGVGGGFLVVPALLLALALPMDKAAGTSLVVITITSATALAVRAGSGPAPDWTAVLALTGASAATAVLGARLAGRIGTRRLQTGFTVLVLLVALYTATRAVLTLT
ncbi:sulfite exporter TauE/SafE family protein [Nocardioides marmotae]|uniref:sulfite exporter TauE/SafE family protein n=1 Tax=Nocardioides marmotae TaxID=2663857 RepID=UPI0012B5BAB0|nr:sulfite exporter TauE/SafE family protein [Nocardioides marmotae]MBC9731835.1 sulfite exporter TauE/SafE family protein [Nocardioides marmotae]MTB82955.1 TSUP family transporter [Nocardioides marmotae]